MIHSKGMTLMELLIVIAIIAILASIVMPNYLSYMEQARRADAVTGLENLRIQQEKWRRNNTSYASAVTNVGGSSTLEGHYTLSVTGASATGYTGLAVPVAGGAQASDTCGTFAINQDGPDTSGSYANNRCWRR